ncbi:MULTISPECIES: hypothetical protein [Acidithrix]|uniref:Uncharacterized protein n=1 Tax=Acidithrix ferrooxidans TaxID=1280514 RepID=A0A0D8HIY0_9ACTN|nr:MULTISPECIES: hypothetical protein [Acidithrix]KJF17900.1 hypothetical protein AXFE_11820 [Acidithrix ferrooxidans]CAG4934025.1 unnamed protein product [Acidithrix sp. C25]
MAAHDVEVEIDGAKDASARAQSKIIRDYLEALERNRPRRGRKRTRDTVEKQLALVEEQLNDADPLDRLHLIQKRIDLEAELVNLKNKVDIGELEERFVASAREYSDRKGISYDAWHALGIPNETLEKAGIDVPKVTTRRRRSAE